MKLEQLHSLLRNHPGKSALTLNIYMSDGNRVPCRCPEFRVAADGEMQTRVEELLGPNHVRVQTAFRNGR